MAIATDDMYVAVVILPYLPRIILCKSLRSPIVIIKKVTVHFSDF